jgi:hypothetical protein
MIELGALLGAMLMANAVIIGTWNEATSLGVPFLVAPLVGALWGAAVAAIIHFTADGTLFSLVFGAIGAIGSAVLHHPH